MRIFNEISDVFIVDVVKMSFKEVVKYFRRTSWRFGQSRTICFTVKVSL